MEDLDGEFGHTDFILFRMVLEYILAILGRFGTDGVLMVSHILEPNIIVHSPSFNDSV